MAAEVPALIDPIRMIDEIAVGDIIRWGCTNVLVREIYSWEGEPWGAFISWRRRGTGTLAFNYISQNYCREYRGIISRGNPLDATPEESRLQKAVEEGRIDLQCRRAPHNVSWWHVYFVACPSANLVKIGIAREVSKRFRNLELQSAHPITLLGVIEGDWGLEAELHARFAHLRQHGEWFTLTSELRAFIAEATA